MITISDAKEKEPEAGDGFDASEAHEETLEVMTRIADALSERRAPQTIEVKAPAVSVGQPVNHVNVAGPTLNVERVAPGGWEFEIFDGAGNLQRRIRATPIATHS